MRKGKSIIKTILIWFLLFYVGYTVYQTGIIQKYIFKQSVNSLEYQKIKSQLNEYKKADADQKSEDERLRNILMMNTINSEIRKNTKLQLCEGDKTQQVPIKKDAFIKWFDNTLHAEIPYTYRIILDTQYIKATKIENNTVTYEINIRDKFEIVTELHADKLKFAKDNKYCTVKFYESDIQKLLQKSQKVIIEQVAGNKEIFNIAVEGLEEYLKSEAQVFGCTAEIIYQDW
jgi:carboxypeptidase C (cathepsin A)